MPIIREVTTVKRNIVAVVIAASLFTNLTSLGVAGTGEIPAPQINDTSETQMWQPNIPVETWVIDFSQDQPVVDFDSDFDSFVAGDEFGAYIVFPILLIVVAVVAVGVIAG